MLTVKKSKAAIPRRRFGKFLERKGKNTKKSKKENKKWGEKIRGNNKGWEESKRDKKGGKRVKETKIERKEQEKSWGGKDKRKQ